MSVYADLIRYRELFGSLFRRDLRARYKGTIFGVAWSLVNPIMLAAIYVLVFSLLWEVMTGRFSAGPANAIPAHIATINPTDSTVSPSAWFRSPNAACAAHRKIPPAIS